MTSTKSSETKIKKLRQELSDEENRANRAQIKIQLTEEWIRERKEAPADEKNHQLILDNLQKALSAEQDRNRLSEQKSALIRKEITAAESETVTFRKEPTAVESETVTFQYQNDQDDLC